MMNRKRDRLESHSIYEQSHAAYVGLTQRQFIQEEAQIKAEWHAENILSLQNEEEPTKQHSNSQFSYMKKYEDKYGSKNSASFSEEELESSLRQMRMLLQIIDTIASEKMNKNYGYLAPILKERPALSIEKQIEIYKASIQNNNKKLAIQEVQMSQTEQIEKGIGDSQTILDKLDQQIKVVARKVYEMDKEVKDKQVEINKLDLFIIDRTVGIENNEIYLSYTKVKHMHDYKSNQLRRHEERTEFLDQKKEDLTYIIEQLQEKLVQLIKVAQQQFLEVSTNKQFINLKEKFQELKKQKLACERKVELAEKARKHNQFGLFKIKNDYEKKLQETQTKITTSQIMGQSIQKTINDLVKYNKAHQIHLKSVANRYADTMIKKDPKSEDKLVHASSIFRIQKPNLRPKMFSRLAKSLDKVDNKSNVSELSIQNISPILKNQIQNQKIGNFKPKVKVVEEAQIQDQIFDFDDTPKVITKKPFRIGKPTRLNQESIDNIENETQLVIQGKNRPGTKSQIDIPIKNNESKEDKSVSLKPFLRPKKRKVRSQSLCRDKLRLKFINIKRQLGWRSVQLETFALFETWAEKTS